MSQLKFGTCSWKYDSWQGIIYSDAARQNYLKEYARHFNTVEIDQWFWSLFPGKNPAMPRGDTVHEYVTSVPENFKFSVKVPNSITLTHYYHRGNTGPLIENPNFLSQSLFELFLDSVVPMREKLGPLIFQFEYLNKQKMPSQAVFLDRIVKFVSGLFPGFSYFIETRNPNYLDEKYFKAIGDLNLRLVFLQGYYMPDIFGIYQKYEQYIKDAVVIRLHGPDRQGMEKQTNGVWNKIVAPKDHELQALAQMLRTLDERNVDAYINVNNHYEGCAPLTIQRLKALL